MNKPKQKYQVSMSLGYSTIVEAVNMVDAIEIAVTKPCASGGEWGDGVWDSDTIDVELVQDIDVMTLRVEAALDSYAIAAVCDRDSALTDLLADAMLVHGGEAVEAHITKARMHYEDEAEDHQHKHINIILGES
tara:strand:- start:570 stop:971 length:402 start_codon:yes stop_codon:yes gene_type:complete